jgi:hypothetical protein
VSSAARAGPTSPFRQKGTMAQVVGARRSPGESPWAR